MGSDSKTPIITHNDAAVTLSDGFISGAVYPYAAMNSFDGLRTVGSVICHPITFVEDKVTGAANGVTFTGASSVGVVGSVPTGRVRQSTTAGEFFTSAVVQDSTRLKFLGVGPTGNVASTIINASGTNALAVGTAGQISTAVTNSAGSNFLTVGTAGQISTSVTNSVGSNFLAVDGSGQIRSVIGNVAGTRSVNVGTSGDLTTTPLGSTGQPLLQNTNGRLTTAQYGAVANYPFDVNPNGNLPVTLGDPVTGQYLNVQPPASGGNPSMIGIAVTDPNSDNTLVVNSARVLLAAPVDNAGSTLVNSGGSVRTTVTDVTGSSTLGITGSSGIYVAINDGANLANVSTSGSLQVVVATSASSSDSVEGTLLPSDVSEFERAQIASILASAKARRDDGATKRSRSADGERFQKVVQCCGQAGTLERGRFVCSKCGRIHTVLTEKPDRASQVLKSASGASTPVQRSSQAATTAAAAKAAN
jgi:hypothetical protein